MKVTFLTNEDKKKIEEQIPSRTSQLTNDSGFLKEHQDLSDYAKKSDVPTKTSQLDNDKGFLTEHQDLSNYAEKSEVPTRTSQLINDSGFVNSAPVTSVNGKSGDVQLAASDIGADVSGSANNALIDAKNYTDDKLSGKANTSDLNTHTNNELNPHKVTAAQVGARPSTWMPSASDVGADATGTASSVVSNHNTSTSAHNDIRNLISTLTTKVNNFLDVDDTTTDQLSEVLELIENNKGTLESLTTGKVNVSDIVDNLTTNSASKVLSAAQGVALKSLVDALQSTVNGKAEAGHNHDDKYYTESEIDTKLSSKVEKDSNNNFTGKNVFYSTASFFNPDDQKFVVGDSGSAFVFGSDGLQTFAGTSSSTPKVMYINCYGGGVSIGKQGGDQNMALHGSVHLGGNTNIVASSGGGDTPLRIQSDSASAFIEYKNSNGETLGYYGVNSDKQAVFHANGDKKIYHEGNKPSASDVGADPVGSANTALTSANAYTDSKLSDKANASDLVTHIGSKSNPHAVTAEQIGAVPTSRTVNGKSLSSDVEISVSDLGLKVEAWKFTLEDGSTTIKGVYVV